jgi:hypothetical protein
MKITFTELEESEQRYFEEALGTHELSFVHSLDEVMPDTEVLSVFISGACYRRLSRAASGASAHRHPLDHGRSS